MTRVQEFEYFKNKVKIKTAFRKVNQERLLKSDSVINLRIFIGKGKV